MHTFSDRHFHQSRALSHTQAKGLAPEAITLIAQFRSAMDLNKYPIDF
jgi:hypothetical protein